MARRVPARSVDLDTLAIRPPTGRFNGRWDDPDGNYRTLYTGNTLLGCLLEVLAGFRPDPTLADDLDGIIEDPYDELVHPTPAPGIVPRAAASSDSAAQ